MAIRTAAFVAIALSACSHGSAPSEPPRDGGAGPADVRGDTASTADAGVMVPFEVARPNIPWLDAGEPPVAPPLLTPCADGWSETELAGVTSCEPWPYGDTHECPPGEAQLLGNVGCVPLGGACPSGDFADNLPSDRPVVYVHATASPGGDGSLGAPYATLAEALMADLEEGTLIALSAGTHEGAIMPPGLALVGACPGRTVLTAQADAEAALRVEAGTLDVRTLRIEPGGTRGLVASGPSTTLTLRAVEVAHAQCQGIDVSEQATLDAEQLVVRDTSGPCSSSVGGILVVGAWARVRRSLIAANVDYGVLVGVEADVTADTSSLLEDVIVRGHQSELSTTGRGVVGLVTEDATASATLEVRRALFEHNRGGSILVRGSGMNAEVTDVLARHNGGGIDVELHVDVNVIADAALTLRRSTIRDMTNPWPGAISFERSARPSTLEDVLIAENRTTALRLLLHEGGVHGRRLVIASNVHREVLVAGGALTLTDARIRPDRPQPRSVDPLTGETVPYAPVVVTTDPGMPSSLTLRSSVVERSLSSALTLLDSTAVGSTAVLEDVAIRDSGAVSGSGHGILAGHGAEVTGHRFLLDPKPLAAIAAANGGGRVTLEDAVLREVAPYPGEDIGGRGVTLAGGSTALLRRTRIEGTHEMGLAAFGSAVTLEDVEVRHTENAACAGRGACLAHGHAVGMYRGSMLTATRFLIDDAEACGVHFAGGSEVDLMEGVVSHTQIGACIQVDGYDADRLSHGVFYLNNGRNLDATELPVPDPGG